MDTYHDRHISNFFIAGINYKKSDAAVRGQFAISSDQYQKILNTALQKGFREVFILSTCNRTEIYGFAQHASQLIDLLCSETAGDKETFHRLAYVKNGRAAIEHVYCVAAGLDSQILGDYEIVGQLKTSVRFSKEQGCIGAFTERLINSVLQSSKEIKNNTALSGGTVSVSFAAVQYIRNTANIRDKNILLLGTGKIGRNTCKNLVDYGHTKNITLINRTFEKAKTLADELGLLVAPQENLREEIRKADIILVATNASEPVILASHLTGTSSKLIIDLSIPYNVEAAAKDLPGVKVVNVDELSKLKDNTLKKREAEVPKAKAIIAESIAEFTEWYHMRKHAPLLKAVKLKLTEIHTHPLFVSTTLCPKERDARIQRTINDMASKVKLQNKSGCHYIEAINHFIKSGAKN